MCLQQFDSTQHTIFIIKNVMALLMISKSADITPLTLHIRNILAVEYTVKGNLLIKQLE